MSRKILFQLERYHWLLLVFTAPFLVFPSPKRSIALLIIPLLWGLYLWRGKKNRIESIEYKIGNVAEFSPDSEIKPGFPVTPLNLSLLILVLMQLVSLWATYSMELSLEKVTGLILGLGVFYAVVRESGKTDGWWWSVLVFAGGGLGWATLGLLGMEYQTRFSFLTPIIERIPILIQSFPTLDAGLQHNAVGGTLVWILPAMIGFSLFLIRYKIDDLRLNIEDWWLVKRWGKTVWGVWVIRLGIWLGTLFMMAVLILTQSRGSIIAIFLTAIIFTIIILPKKWRWVLGGLLILSTIGGIVYIQVNGGWDSMIADIGLSGESGLSIDTLSARLEIWSRALYGLQDFPFTGMGMNTFREVVDVFYPLFTIPPDFDIAHAHNEFLQVGLDLGLPGMIAFLSINVISFSTLFRLWKVSDQPDAGSITTNPFLQKVLILGLGGGLFAHLIFGMLDAITLGAKPGIFFWLLLGLIMGLDSRLKIEN